MSRSSVFSSPLLLGFENIERMLDRVAKSSADGYPPYNIERLADDDAGDIIRITLAVAGFTSAELDVAVEERQLTIRGKQVDDDEGRLFLHRGIAARQFQKAFVLAEGIEVLSADLKDGLLSVDLVRPRPEKTVKKISINHNV